MPKFTELPMLRVGLIGSGFIAAFHLQSMVGVRNVSIGGVYSRSAERRTRIAEKARSLGLGEARAFDSIEAMLNAVAAFRARAARGLRRGVGIRSSMPVNVRIGRECAARGA